MLVFLLHYQVFDQSHYAISLASKVLCIIANCLFYCQHVQISFLRIFRSCLALDWVEVILLDTKSIRSKTGSSDSIFLLNLRYIISAGIKIEFVAERTKDKSTLFLSVAAAVVLVVVVI